MDASYHLKLFVVSLAGWFVYLLVRPKELKFWFKRADTIAAKVLRVLLLVIAGYLILVLLSAIGGKIPSLE